MTDKVNRQLPNPVVVGDEKALDRFLNQEILPLLKLWRASYNAANGPITQVTADTTVTDEFQAYLIDATDGAVTMTLPAADAAKMRYVFKKIDASGNAVTVTRASTDDSVEGGASVTLAAQYDFKSVVSNETDQWFVVADG